MYNSYAIKKIATDNFNVKQSENDIYLGLEDSELGFYLKINQIDELICLLDKAKNEFVEER